MNATGQVAKPENKQTQRLLNKFMKDFSVNAVLNKSFSNWKFHVMMQPFFGKVKGGDKITFRRPRGNEKMSESDSRLYIGTKMVWALPMTKEQYCGSRGWIVPDDEDGNESGFKIKYPDGYISWSPLQQFNEAYRLTDGMNFGLAIEAMKRGYKVAREGWNGKGMFCIYVAGTENAQLVEGTPYYEALNNVEGGQSHVEILPHFDMYTTNAEGRRAFLPGWLASQSDMDANDWGIID